MAASVPTSLSPHQEIVQVHYEDILQKETLIAHFLAQNKRENVNLALGF